MRILTFSLLVFVNASVVFGQKDVVTFLQTPEITDQLSLMYLEPMAKMTNGSINAGWYHSAKPHRFLGFDVSLSMTSTSVPTTNKGFYLTNIPDFETYYTLTDGSSSVMPNVAGVTNDLPIIKSKEDSREIEMPNGNGLDKISLPMITAGIGLPYQTEVRLRFMPKMANGDMGKLMQYGLSVKHGLKEYFPGLEDLPALSLSVMGGYTGVRNDIEVEYPSSVVGGQMLKGKSSGYTGRFLVGMDVAVFSAYMGLGYGASSTEYTLEGKYYIGDVANEEEVSNPVVVSYDYSQVEFSLGLNAKIGMFDLFVDYSPGEYKAFNFGLGYTMR